VRSNISIGIQYIESWLRGTGAAAIFNLMEDAATAEISRSQVWQWIHHGATLTNGQRVTRQLVNQLEEEELEKIRESQGAEAAASSRLDEARALFDDVALSDQFVEFLTLPAYGHLD
jgi:malate synthase